MSSSVAFGDGELVRSFEVGSTASKLIRLLPMLPDWYCYSAKLNLHKSELNLIHTYKAVVTIWHDPPKVYTLTDWDSPDLDASTYPMPGLRKIVEKEAFYRLDYYGEQMYGPDKYIDAPLQLMHYVVDNIAYVLRTELEPYILLLPPTKEVHI